MADDEANISGIGLESALPMLVEAALPWAKFGAALASDLAP